ncbi:electron transfer flavoprotein subunit beta/FixA family protein [Tumebacillus sp. ITR2]|jgi:electron transfer flavoprotein beta subunit|uniref:Electron transfer flavoprotein subunit beta n=1 Tax=Tumebacillus amylolyticus TaxID=2801339 RepID=A0ABS1J8Z4_9BACL|nr:electron transfer flavoprotein subunit beta/FixA family protein [Tumebacillus amylolyticus]MBL0386740.1 electron transfer flavoprotein subunit beta/FixA family protein [Tumebacillus amylolyticus]
MNIFVALKQTFDTEEKIVVENGSVKEDGVRFVLNPYDEYAVEEAIKLRDELGGQVTVVTVGPERAQEALRTALAMGADEAVHITDEALFGDEYKVSNVLASYFNGKEFDIILTGNQAVDSGSGQTAVRLAELLNIAHVSTITKLEINGTDVVAHRDAEGDLEVVGAKLPLLVTCQQGLNDPRYPSLIGIRKANKKPLDTPSAGDLGVDAAISSKSSVQETFLPAAKAAGRIIEGDNAQRVTELVNLLKNEAKVL